MITNDYRQDEVTAMGLTAEQIAAHYGELREQERLQREWKWNIRDAAASMYGGMNVREFKNRNRRAFNCGDMTNIPGFDSMAQELASWFPELDDDDKCQRLFDLLREPFDRLPPAEDTYREAIDRLLDDIRTGHVAEYDYTTEF